MLLVSRTEVLSIKIDEKDLKLCQKCEMNWKPERAHHCSRCRVCVFKMDHHCPWINNCVGGNNIPLFSVFILSMLTYTSVMSEVLIRFIRDELDHKSTTIKKKVCTK